MKTHKFQIVGGDTDAVFFKKSNESPFTKEEFENLLIEINSYMDDGMVLEDDGNYQNFVTVKAKNYVTREVGSDEIKYKGSSMKDAKKEPALKELMKRVIEDSLIHETHNYVDIYEEYVQEVMNIQDISRWSVKKSISETLYKSDRANETKVVDAIKGIDVSIGDKVFLYNTIDGMKQKSAKGELVFLKSGEPKMVENKILQLSDTYDGNYDKKHYLQRVYKTISILSTVIDMDKIINYSLTRNYKKLVD